MNTLFESLNNVLKSDKPKENRRLRHPHETEIIERAMNNLSQSDMGRELIDFVQDNNIVINILRGRHNRDHSNSDNVVFMSLAENINIRDPEITIHLAGAIREVAQEHDTHLRRVAVEQGESIYVHREGMKYEDKLYWQTGVVYELGKVAGKVEFIDSFTLMGYGLLVDAYEQDLIEKTGQNNNE